MSILCLYMALQQLAVKEQLVKKVVKSGNGGAVWVPKTWLGEEVVVILHHKPKVSLQEQIMHVLEPHLQDILSVSIYGSYARNEATKESDIDVLVITKDKQFAVSSPNGKIEVLVLPFHKMQQAIEKYPTLYYQIVHEAKPIINSSILEELKRVHVNKKMFSSYLQETKEHIKSNKEFIELDKLDGNYLTSFSVLYSLFLRLRAVFIMDCILAHDSFSNKRFKKWLADKEINSQEFEMVYDAYRKVRDNKNTSNTKIKISSVEKILSLLEQEVKKLEDRL